MLYHKNFTRRNVMQGFPQAASQALRLPPSQCGLRELAVAAGLLLHLSRPAPPSFRKEQGGERDFKLGPISRPLDKPGYGCHSGRY